MQKSSELVAPPLLLNTEKVSWRALLENDWLMSGLLVLVGAIPTAALWRHSAYLTGDSYQYLRAALTLSQGQGFQDMSGNPFTFLTPLYPLVVGMVHRITPGSNIETTARLVSFVGASTAVVSFYKLLRVRYALWVSFSAAFLFALLPLRVWSGFWILSEGLFLGLLMLGLVTLFNSDKRSWPTSVLGGILLGLAYLTRPEALLCAGCAAVVFWFSGSTGKKKALLMLFGFLILALAYHTWVYQVTGGLSSGRLNLLFAQSESFHQGLGPQFVYSHELDQTGSSVRPRAANMSLVEVMKRYAFFARWEMNRLIYDLGPYLIVLVLLVVGIIGLVSHRVRLLKGFTFKNAWQFLLPSILLVLPLLHVEDRYFLQALPVILLWLVLIVAGVQKLAASRLPQRWKMFAALIPLSFVSLFTASYVSRLATQVPARDPSTLARNTARWLEFEKLSLGQILSQTPDMAFFSGARHLWMPSGNPDQVVTYAQRNGARYIYVSSQDVATPLTRILLDSAQTPPALKLLHEETDGTARSRLFQLN